MNKIRILISSGFLYKLFFLLKIIFKRNNLLTKLLSTSDFGSSPTQNMQLYWHFLASATCISILEYDFNFRVTRPRGMQMWLWLPRAHTSPIPTAADNHYHGYVAQTMVGVGDCVENNEASDADDVYDGLGCRYLNLQRPRPMFSTWRNPLKGTTNNN